MSQSNRDRILQIARWLAAEFPGPYPVTVKCVNKIGALPGSDYKERQTGDFGETYRYGRRITIRISCRPSFHRATLIDTLLHEWAHAASMRHASLEEKRLRVGGHDDEWALLYGRIYRRFIDEGGAAESRSY